jgi:hypothetical protein
MEDVNNVWLSEPVESDPSFAKDDEDFFVWLTKSTNQRAINYRKYLNSNINKLPKDIRKKIEVHLKAQLHNAHFELVLARLFQILDFAYVYEEELSNGRKPDFLISSEIGDVIVEAISPVFNNELSETYLKHIPLIKIIRSEVPEDWIACIHSLPNIGANDSKRYFKKIIKDAFANFMENPTNDYSIIESFQKGKLEINLIHKPNRKNEIGILPVIAYVENSESRILHAINEKREQLRNLPHHNIIAIQGSFTGTDMEDYDKVLFGYCISRINHKFEEVESKFDPCGVFVSDNPEPTFSGLLAFEEIKFSGIKPPILYLHQRADKRLFDLFNMFDIRFYNEETNSIECRKAIKEVDLSSLNILPD